MAEPTKKRTAFVVDDELVITSTLAAILRLNGFDATSFSAPLEALDAARSQAPDLLVSDVIMPLMSGIELAIEVKRSCPDCKVLLLSGQAVTTELLATAKADG